MQTSFRLKFGTMYIHAIKGIICVFMPNNIDASSIWGAFLEE